MYLSQKFRLATVALALLGTSVASGSKVEFGDRGEAVREHSPSVVRMSELPRTETGLILGPPKSHIQGDPAPRFQRGVDLFDPSREPRPDVESAEPEFRQDSGQPNRSAINLNMKAIDYTGWIPPDAVVAANNGYTLAAVNNGLTVYDAAGTEIAPFTTFTTFFQTKEPAGWQGFYFDPRVAYVSAEGQFLMVVLGRDDIAQSSYIFLAVSQTGNPSGAWWLYRYRADKGSQSNFWLDFPALAGDKWGVYFTGNYFSNSTNTFQHPGLWSINPAVYTGGSGNGWKKTTINWPSTGSPAFSIQPAVPYSTASGEETFFAATHSGSGDDVLLMTMTGDRTNAPSLTKVEVPIRSYDQIGSNVDQPGSSLDLDGGDCRLGNAVYAQRRVYVTLSTDPDNNGNSGGVIVAKLNVDSGTREWQSLTKSSGSNYYFYPAVTINDGGSSSPKIAWFGTWASASQDPSTLYRLYDSGTSHTPIEFISTMTGTTDYQLLDSSGRNRWGDYSGAALRVGGSHEMCGLSQYSTSGTTWATRLVCID